MSLDLRTTSSTSTEYSKEISWRVSELLAAWFSKEWIHEIAFKISNTLWLSPWEKIEELTKLGFKDPLKLITSSPAILGYSIEDNIKPKVNLLDRFIKDTDLARNLIMKAPELLGTKIDKTWTILRWLHTLWLLNNAEVIQKYKSINMGELESFVLAVNKLRWTSPTSIPELLKVIKWYKKAWTKQDRRNTIIESLNWKTVKRYKRGYP